MNVLDDYSSFMVFELKDSGEGERVNITEKEFSKDNANKILHDSQVVLIVKEDLRRIYIWKGHQSTVRKKFIASRVAQNLQQELTYSANFHRCKIVSVDQGEEPLDSLNSFGLKSQKITKTEEINQLKFTTLNYPKSQPKFSEKPKNIHIEPSKEVKKRLRTSNNNILSRILQIESPEGYIRNHILIGNNTLYGIVVKKTEIFGKSIEESEWNSINDFSNSVTPSYPSSTQALTLCSMTLGSRIWSESKSNTYSPLLLSTPTWRARASESAKNILAP